MIQSILDRPSLQSRRLSGAGRNAPPLVPLPLTGAAPPPATEETPFVRFAEASPASGGRKSRAALLLSSILGLTILTPASAQNAADEYYGAEEMAAARHMARHHHGGMTNAYFEGERLEYRSNEGDPVFGWEAQGWYGGDLNKVWMKTEGEVDLESGAVDDGEAQALVSRAIGPFFDVQAGVRRDFGEGPNRTHAVIGVQGLAPYLFEVDAAAFVSGHGDVTARIEGEYELLLTQRLILQPRAELEFSAQDVPELGLGSGLTTVEAGARLRYEVTRRFAPYIGVSWERDVGRTADFTRLNGEDPGGVSFVAGLRVWF